MSAKLSCKHLCSSAHSGESALDVQGGGGVAVVCILWRKIEISRNCYVLDRREFVEGFRTIATNAICTYFS